jgi:hypothetical protein
MTKINLKLTVTALSLLVLVAVVPQASAKTVTFQYVFKCEFCQASMQLTCMQGGISSDSITIATVQSDVPGYTNPVPITAGLLNWTSAPATSGNCDPAYWGAEYGNPGGSASITGAVFGLPSGSTLLTASFQGGASSLIHEDIETYYKGATFVLYVNPAILANLGLVGYSTVGTGYLDDHWYTDGQGNDEFYVTVTFTPVSPNAVADGMGRMSHR